MYIIYIYIHDRYDMCKYSYTIVNGVKSNKDFTAFCAPPFLLEQI